MTELAFLAAVFTVIAVTVGLCVHEGLLERNPRLVAPDDLSSLRRHTDARSACRSAGRVSARRAPAPRGVRRPAGDHLDRGVHTAAHLTPPSLCGLQVASTVDPRVDWETAGWA
jgi:hypothetical protein